MEQIKNVLEQLIAKWVFYLWSALFIYWGYSVLTYKFNLPNFSYWEVLGVRIGLTYLCTILGQLTHTTKLWDNNDKD